MDEVRASAKRANVQDVRPEDNRDPPSPTDEPPSKRARSLVRKPRSTNLHGDLRGARDPQDEFTIPRIVTNENEHPGSQPRDAHRIIRDERLTDREQLTLPSLSEHHRSSIYPPGPLLDASVHHPNILTTIEEERSSPWRPAAQRRRSPSHEPTAHSSPSRKRKRASSPASPPISPPTHPRPPPASTPAPQPSSQPPTRVTPMLRRPPTSLTPHPSHASAATPTLFRPAPPSSPHSPTKKTTRPHVSSIYQALRVPAEDFLALQSLAKTYMLDPLHPPRRSCVGARGDPNTELTRLKLYRCVEAFLDDEQHVGERFFAPGLGEDRWEWPRDREDIIRVITPVLRRVVTNERQRIYAIDMRGGRRKKQDGESEIPSGIVDAKKRAFEGGGEVTVPVRGSSVGLEGRKRRDPGRGVPVAANEDPPGPRTETLVRARQPRERPRSLSIVDPPGRMEAPRPTPPEFEITLVLPALSGARQPSAPQRLPTYLTRGLTSFEHLLWAIGTQIPPEMSRERMVVEALTVERGLVVVRDEASWEDVVDGTRKGKGATVLKGKVCVLVTFDKQVGGEAEMRR